MGNFCKSNNDCCPVTEVCNNGYCENPNHIADPVHYDPDPTHCIKQEDSTCTTLPKGSKAYCYADDAEHPQQSQFCAYEKDGFLVGVEPGCCNKTCPNEECDPVQTGIQPADPEKQRPRNAPFTTDKKKKKRSDNNEPFPLLLKLLLIIFAILLVSAGIFLSVG